MSDNDDYASVSVTEAERTALIRHIGGWKFERQGLAAAEAAFMAEVSRIVAAREADIWDEAKVVMARPVPRAWRKWCDDADAKVERVLALIEGAERRSPIGAEHDRKHPDEPASVLVPTRDIRAALSLEAEGD